jgi:hypothetical protein
MLGGMHRRLAAALVLAACFVVVAGCGGGDGSTSGSTAAPGQREPQAGASQAGPPTVRVARAKSVSGVEKAGGRTPAAGVCPEGDEPVMTVDLHIDTPEPRCVVLHSSQRLRLVNLTGVGPGGKATAVRVDFAGFTAKLAPGQAAIFDAPAGSYLAAGTHGMEVKGAPGPQVWVK